VRAQANLVELVRGVCERHKLSSICVCGHSFGSIYAGWVLRGLPSLVKQAAFVDPVCLLLCLPTVSYAFLYKRFSPVHDHHNQELRGLSWRDALTRLVLEAIVYYGMAREVTVSNAIRRHFWWVPGGDMT
jgi:hypothetical protein